MRCVISLVHHALDATPGVLSPFVERILALAEESDLCVACPYVGLRVLHPILEVATSWRLLTDIEELLKSHPTSQRAELLKFLVEHENQIRHWPDLHAKVVIGNTAALVGSANLTTMGLGQRQEMAVSLEAPALVAQLRAWFDELWERCRSVSSVELEKLAASLPRTRFEELTFRLESPAPKVSAAVLRRTVNSQQSIADGEVRLRERLAYGVSREWANAYLDMCADLLATLEIPEDDLRLSMSVPSSDHSLPVTINQRYVLCAFHRGKSVVGMMLPRSIKLPESLLPAMHKVRDHLGSFRPWPGELPEDVPRFAYFEVDDPRDLRPLRNEWLFAALQETERPWKQSSFRRHHVPAFHRAVTDPAYRDTLLLMVGRDNEQG